MPRVLLVLSLIIPSLAGATNPTSHRTEVRDALIARKSSLLAEIPSFERQGAACLAAVDQYRSAIREYDMWSEEVAAYNAADSQVPVELRTKAVKALAQAEADITSAVTSAVTTGQELDAGYRRAYAILDEVGKIDVELAKLDSRVVGLPVARVPTTIVPLEVDGISALMVMSDLIDLPSEFDQCKRNREFFNGTVARLTAAH